MSYRLHRILALGGLLLALSPVHCRALDQPPTQNVDLITTQGLTDQELQEWHRTSAGTQLIPYDWLVALTDDSLAKGFAATGLIADPGHPDKLPIGFSKTEGTTISTAQAGLTCAFCHTTQLTYKGQSMRIEGGPSLQYNAHFLAVLLKRLAMLIPSDGAEFHKSLKELDPPEPFKTFAGRVLSRREEATTAYTLTALAVEVETRTQILITRGSKDLSPEQWGPGRFDALGRGGNTVFGPLNPDNLRPANASVSIPPLWGVWEYDWVQWAGSIQHPLARNIAQVIGVNAGLFAWAQPGVSLPEDRKDIFRSSVDISSLKKLETLARRLFPPHWPTFFPAINRELAARGKELYHGDKRKGIQNLCAHCHVATKIPSPSPDGPNLHVTMVPLKEIGTDSLYLENFSRRTVDTGLLGHGRLSAREASQLITTELMAANGAGEDREYQHRTNIWRDTAQYIARPHLAVWATAPFLHNGSVPNLYELLSPAKERHACFYVSPNMEFDPKHVGFAVEECTGAPAGRDLLGGFEYRTQLPGNGNKGHEFADTLDCESSKSSGVLGCKIPESDRWAIIEYLKTCDLDRLVMTNAPICRDLE
ncbi:conserved exported protein of unknown function [Nitrospira defluvii]|jgi:hypothetical protein|uniref:Cytochrome c domain-containing protein n=1 Tax=Nitrospira defluvii TaxID=330214 RepID=D8PAS3_9BACT|nr:conserved exported protein of unknown function [Nitrospira defluvii]